MNVAVAVTLAIFVVTHIIITVWWASRVNTLLDIVQGELKEIVLEFKGMREAYVTKETFAARIATSEKEHLAMWREIDRAKTRHGERDPT